MSDEDGAHENRVEGTALDALDAYVEALLAGEAVDADEWLARHPGLDAALREELELVASLHRVANSVALDTAGEEAPQPAEERHLLPSGTRLGEHVVEALIGVGGMGEVYRARHEILGRDVAIKVLRPYLVDQPEAVARFRREVQAQASLGAHPNVVGAMHASQHDGRLYLVMEHVPGTNLSKLVRDEGPLPPLRACDLIRQAALGLAHAHRAGIVHRDVKPSNLLLTPEGVVKVVDLGLARLLQRDPDESGSRKSWVDELVGSLDYMAPEQANRPDDADARSDLYALGCTLYFLLEGHAPFADRLALKKLMAHAVDPPPPLRRAVPQPVREVLSRLLAKDPDDRYASADALVEALDAVLRDEGPSRRESSASRRTTLPETAAPTKPTAWRVVAVLATVAALAAGGALAFVLLRPVEITPPPSAPSLAPGVPIAGALTAEDPRRPKERAPFDVHAVQVQRGVTYVFTMSSRELDPMLLLRADGWELEASDDAPGLGNTAQIVWTADRDGALDVVATTAREGAFGAYVVTMDRLALPALAMNATVEGRLEDGDERRDDDGRLDRHWLRLDAGQTVVLQVRAEGFAPTLSLESDLGARLATGEASAAHEARLVHVAERAGAVFVAVGASDGGRGSYRLSAAAEDAGREVLRVSGALGEGDPVLSDQSFYESHELPTRQGYTYVITMQSSELDTYLLLIGPDDARLAHNDDALGTDSRIVYTAPRDAVLRVYANSFAAGMRGRYTLTARELAP
jgi:hypothetical protein